MRKIIRPLLTVSNAVIAALGSTVVASAYSSGTRLVYSFTYSSDQNITARDSANQAQPMDANGAALGGGGSGASHYHGNLGDKGTITVAIVRQQNDGGLIVSISEQGEAIRRAPPATCVVYGNTQVICDPDKTVYPEEYTLLRFLGPKFVDPTQLDANRHWSLTQDGASESVKSDYVIDSSNNGSMQIGEKRTIKQSAAGHLTTDVQTKIGYDFTRLIPTSVDEYATEYSDNGMSGTTRTTYQTTLNLVSDSVANQ